jgi:GNAT superfamily N-acetyltransferase
MDVFTRFGASVALRDLGIGKEAAAKLRFVHTIDRGDSGKKKDRAHRVIEARIGKKQVGWITHHPGSDGDYTYLKGMHVKPSHQGRGIGRKLLQEAIKVNEGKEMQLRARPFKNSPMSVPKLKKMYKSFGFKAYGKEDRMVRRAS